jgi:hypothetical protein
MNADSKLSYDAKIQIKELLQQILEQTKNTSLTETEHSVDDYINMVESRQSLFDKLAALKPQEFGTHSGESKNEQAGNLEIDEEIKSLVNLIAECEERHKGKVAGMMEDLKKGMRDISAEKSINTVYNKDSYESGMIFKSKN